MFEDFLEGVLYCAEVGGVGWGRDGIFCGDGVEGERGKKKEEEEEEEGRRKRKKKRKKKM